jgi:DNA processing protein
MNARVTALREQAHRQLSSFDADHLAFLALACIKGVGFKTLVAMAAADTRFADAIAIDKEDDAIELLRRFGARIDGTRGNDWRHVREQAIERAGRMAEALANDGITLIARTDPRFPKSLLELSSPPHWLFVKGSVEVLQRPSLAIVGTREPSEDGRWLGGFIGGCLARWAAPTVSGLALGIDQLVHEWSLRANIPTTAVLGTGILSDFPKGTAQLRDKIVDAGGALVTEYLPRESYSAENFVRRNRLQAALGRVLIPVEWNLRSGTAHTVRFATALKRPIACLRIPDWPQDRVVLTKGCGEETGRIFTVPGEESELRAYIAHGLSLTVTEPSQKPQLPLFADR